MIVWVFVVLGILGFIGTLLISYRLQSQKHITEINLFKQALEHQLESTDKELGEIAAKLFLAIESRRNNVEEGLLATHYENIENADRIGLQAEEHAAKRKSDTELLIKEYLQKAHRQISELQDHFQESVKGDATKHLMAMAYAVAGGNHKPRDKNDVALFQAVVNHRKAIPVVTKPPNGEMN